MKPVNKFTVSPSLPKKLRFLQDLAYNLQWTWNHDTIELFRRLGFDLWEKNSHNPLQVLGHVDQQKLEALAQDEGFLSHYERVRSGLEHYLTARKTWYRKNFEAVETPLIAYFSAEFGLTECVPIYSGGLGILAGDHLKSASELDLPLVGVGLLYQQGYFRQYLNADGWQQEFYPENDFYNMPVQLQTGDDGAPLTIEVAYDSRLVKAQVWKAQVGRIQLILLDTNIDENQQSDRGITGRLYGGDHEMRIQQEILLGIGGMRALKALGIQPVVYHMNEGHSAFLALERIRLLMQEQHLSFQEARQVAAAGLVFTTHTPVAAGHDYFDPTLMDKYFRKFYAALGLSRDEFLGLGRQNPADAKERFCMTILALRLADYRNAVSRLHEKVSRRMWTGIWKGLPEAEIPISHITNGVHSCSWLSKEMAALFDRYLGPRWREQPADQIVWQNILQIPAAELWRVHGLRRTRLVAFVRRWLSDKIREQSGSAQEIEAAEEILDPDILTIGFARRFASYKRATLLLRDPERLIKLLTDPQRPLQIIFAGKAHPRDNDGKELIKAIIHFARRADIQRRIIFIEDYDIDVARYMVEGVDVWLNTPRRPHEASGTSGMKATFNGAINISTLDGWWDEAYTPQVGWAIGHGEDYEDHDLQDQVESEALYDILENEVIPEFYDRGADGLPRRWVARMKASMANLCPVFNTNRMVRQYTETYYMPAVEKFRRISANEFKAAHDLVVWKKKIDANWPQVKIQKVVASSSNNLKVGDSIEVEVKVFLGALLPKDVLVQLYLGRLDTSGNIVNATIFPMQHKEAGENGTHVFSASAVPCSMSGLHGYTARVMPQYAGAEFSPEPGAITWA